MKREASPFFHVMIHWCLSTKGSNHASWINYTTAHLPNHIFISWIQPKQNMLLLSVFWIFLLASLGIWSEQLFWIVSMYSTTLHMAMISRKVIPSKLGWFIMAFVSWLWETLFNIFKLFPSKLRKEGISWY